MGSDLSKVSERRRLEIHANVLERKSQMEIEKRQRELGLEKTKKQMEMSQKLFDLQAEAEIAEMESRKALEQHELRLQIEEAEGSFRAPSICPSLMSRVLDEDKNSDIKSWLEQSDENFDKCFSQPKESSREVENKGGRVHCLRDFQNILIRKINNCHRNLKTELRVSHPREKTL